MERKSPEKRQRRRLSDAVETKQIESEWRINMTSEYKGMERIIIKVVYPIYQCPSSLTPALQILPFILQSSLRCYGRDSSTFCSAVPFLDTSCKKAILSGEKGYYALPHLGANFSFKEKFRQKKLQWIRICEPAHCYDSEKSLMKNFHGSFRRSAGKRWGKMFFRHLLLSDLWGNLCFPILNSKILPCQILF